MSNWQNVFENGNKNWTPAYGGCDSEGNPITVAFGRPNTKSESHTLIADGDQSNINFHNSVNHNHYGSGSGPNNNAKDRGKYTGPGH